MLAKIVSLLVLGALLAGCSLFNSSGGSLLTSNRSRSTAPLQIPADLEQVAQANTRFGLDLYRALGAQNDDDNLFFSPYSISLALAMTEAGARGETQAEMDRALHFDLPQERLHPALNALDRAVRATPEGVSKEDKDQVFQLSIANAVWGQKDYPFRQEYLDLLAEQYGAGLRVVDYRADPDGARQQINQWVSDETRAKIPELIPNAAIDTETRMVLANAIYFKAGWMEPFDPENTGPAQFTRADGSTKDVWMMVQSGHFPYTSSEGWQALELPYVGGTAGMLVLLPAPGRFADFEAALNAELLAQIVREISSREAIVYLPRFKYESSFELADVLQTLGIQRAFQFGAADFSDMADTNELYISRVIHKATVAVDEAGTEAAAATAVIAAAGAAPGESEPVIFRADRPFLFLIRDRETGTVLFLGRVMEPVE